MRQLTCRLDKLERRSRSQPDRSPGENRDTWPRRFVAQSPGNAELYQRIWRWMAIHSSGDYQPANPCPDIVAVCGALTHVWYFGRATPEEFRGREVATPESMEAYEMILELSRATDAYEDATGDLIPQLIRTNCFKRGAGARALAEATAQ